MSRTERNRNHYAFGLLIICFVNYLILKYFSNYLVLIPEWQMTKWKNQPSFEVKRNLAVSEQRLKVLYEMKDYQYHKDIKGQLTDHQIEHGGQPIHSFICTTWRSGSTFLGEAVNSHPSSFYHFEPIRYTGAKQVREGSLAEESLRVIKQLFNCNYTNLEDFMMILEAKQRQKERNSQVWNNCKNYPELCYDTTYLSDMCKLFPFQTVKTVRLRLKIASNLLKDPSSNVKILLLIRDPRGVMNSRWVLDWCYLGKDCFDPKYLCQDMADDYGEAEILRIKYPDRFLAIRYEDIALNPEEAIQKVYKFFRLQYLPIVQDFVKTHTAENSIGSFTTFRKSKTAAFHWKSDFIGNFSMVTKIQDICNDAMQLWGYHHVTEESNLATFNPLGFPPWKEMLINNITQFYNL